MIECSDTNNSLHVSHRNEVLFRTCEPRIVVYHVNSETFCTKLSMTVLFLHTIKLFVILRKVLANCFC